MESHLTESQVEFFKKDLEDKRQKILTNLQLTSEEVSGDRCCSSGGDESDQASHFQGLNIHQSISEKQAKMLDEIDLSLTKIKEKEYGICEMCEEPIPVERLKVKVFARYCISCREVVEKQEGVTI
jgi:DnaK suppressor protein